MDYGKITVTPTASANTSGSSDISSSNDGDTNTENNNNAQEVSNNLLGNSHSGVTLQNISFRKSMLTYDQVNALTPDQAYKESLRTDRYYHTTILRLRARSVLKYNISASTNYSRFNY
jgi:hypothetical protein